MTRILCLHPVNTEGLPLIYSCSGCSSAAQLANHLALHLDRSEVAEMSCLAGLGGDVRPLVRTAKSGRPLVVIDGCPLHCGLHTLARHGLKPALHWDLSRRKVAKAKHCDFSRADADRLQPELAQEVAALGLRPTATGDPSKSKSKSKSISCST